jgi:hypothetical protein
MERIKCAAVKVFSLTHGGVYEGKNHEEIYKFLTKLGLSEKARCISGFVTDSGRFVSRDEAFEIAVESGQVPDAKPGKARWLISEDLNGFNGEFVKKHEEV